MIVILILAALISNGLLYFIHSFDRCTFCSELKSQLDCETYNTVIGECEWINNICQRKAQKTYLSYCQKIENPQTQCAKTKGCAYIDGQCTHFAGCTAYPKTNNQECQQISSRCITNGVTCVNVQPCKLYSKNECEFNPSPLSPYKCKLENDTCRDYKCTEADKNLTTNQDCNAWLSGCVTTGYGCIDVLPLCDAYKGTYDECNKIFGKDGKCSQSEYWDSCKLRVCSEASLQTWDDYSCNDYKSGCKSTGFSCVDALPACSTYTGNAITCLTYTGSDGQCAYDSTAISCRTRKCEDLASGIEAECQAYLAGCKTNGFTCVELLGYCRDAYGTTTTCPKIGFDGNCKGMISSNVITQCTFKTCAGDDLGTETTDAECELIQKSCKTTGKGCVAILQSCTTYTDDGNCLKYIGSEGKCAGGSGGSEPKCGVRQCTDKKTATKNAECQDYKPGCVTNGFGCVAEMSCSNTLSELTCEGTNHNYQCGWTGSCVNKDCTALNNQSLCSNNKFRDDQPCLWKQDQCINAICSDYVETTDAGCYSHMKGCITNGTTCANPDNCYEFQGNMTTCRGFIKAKCTNIDDSVATITPCITKTCSDNNITTASDSDCQKYLYGCLFAGINRCISQFSDCQSYPGVSTEDCKVFTGYLNSQKRVPCWWQAGGNCTIKVCTLASGMTNDSDCDTFLNGCVYDGNESCVAASADCTDFKYKINSSDCQNLKGVNGKQQCYDGSSNSCKFRECTDAPSTNDTDAKCDAFLSGCLTTGEGCISSLATCSSYKGTSASCNRFKGNSIQCQRKLACVTPTPVCVNKKDAKNNAQCMKYKSTCALSHGITNCIDQLVVCTGYQLKTSATSQDKITYCNTVQITSGEFCAYNPKIPNNCVTRTCDLWNNSLGVPCIGYMSTFNCEYSKGICYTPSTCDSYIVPIGITDKANYCNSFLNSSYQYCQYDSTVSSTNCKEAVKCEDFNNDIHSVTTQRDCYFQTGLYNCVVINNKCVTIQKQCQEYKVPSNYYVSAKTELCKTLKSNNSGIIKQCQYISGDYCDNLTCEEIKGAFKQSDCNILPEHCKYFYYSCYTIQECTSYTIPVNVIDDNIKQQTFCQNMYNKDGKEFCSYNENTSNCDKPKSCNEYDGLTPMDGGINLIFCNSKRDKTGLICTYENQNTTCSVAIGDAICSLIAPSNWADTAFDYQTLPLACQNNGGGMGSIRELCENITPYGSKIAHCQSLTGPDGFYCSYIGGSTCVTSKDTCFEWDGSSVSDCSIYIDKKGNQCSWTEGTKCSNQTCRDVEYPESQADCDAVSLDCVYILTFTKGYCIRKASDCESLNLSGLSEFDRSVVCVQYGTCIYYSLSNNCAQARPCNTYRTVGSNFYENYSYCNDLETIEGYYCIYVSGNYCQEAAISCTSYLVENPKDCQFLRDKQGRSCKQKSNACSYYDCSRETRPKSLSDCDWVAPWCLFYYNQCLTPDQCSTYSTGGLNAKTYCSGLKDNNGVQCFAYTDTDTYCSGRDCADSITQYFTTNKECQDYSSMCKSNGLGCISINEPCSSFYGDSESCLWFLDETGQGNCQGAELATDTQQCTQTTCEINVTAKNQSECDNFLIGGNCKWKNPGCFDQSIPCSQYRGLASECLNFIGKGIKCFGDSQSVRGNCRNRNCNDKITAIDDADCNEFLTDCIFNGVGCIHKSNYCNAFIGTDQTCKYYKANNGNTLCWSKSTQIDWCIKRQCYHLEGTSDAECETHLPNSNCITNGSICVQGPLSCLDFIGDDESCSKFTAVDGPCKASQISSSPVACTPRICNEAPNNYSTDQQCQNYHPTCKTNGRGCQLTVTCEDYQNNKSCSTHSSCLWASSCKSTSNICSNLTQYGQSICVNNPNKKCAWYQDQDNSVCREFQCSDYDATLTTHLQCMFVSNDQCTTSGAGCVEYGICSSYKSKSICSAAQTKEISLKCFWENAKCRQLQCKDIQGTTDDQCNTQLVGCKTNGNSCIGPNYTCNDFNGQQQFCLIDSQGQPCLYVNEICYPYDECTDIRPPSRELCKLFSPNCVSGPTTCIAMNQCKEYKDIESCYQGINNTTCGWLPDQTCTEFKSCNQANGATWKKCQIFNESCISDGINCVPIGDCSSYLKQLSCENNIDAAQYACFWTGTQCRLKQCSDLVSTTDFACLSNIVKEGLCTTNGAKCLLRAACSSYGSQTACTVGSDGIPCYYGYAVGQTTGKQSCRPQECTDIVGTSNDQCIGKINNKPCVSNGKNCVSQGTCSSYKNKVSCAAGGTDNPQCVFTALATTADALYGTCAAFTSCAIAYGDKVTCTSNKSCKYTDSTNKCETTDCETFNENGATKCSPFPSFDGMTSTVCIPNHNLCTQGDPISLAQKDCYSAISLYSYTWNEATLQCQSCKDYSPPNNSSETNNSQSNTNKQTQTNVGYFLVLSIVMFIY